MFQVFFGHPVYRELVETARGYGLSYLFFQAKHVDVVKKSQLSKYCSVPKLSKEDSLPKTSCRTSSVCWHYCRAKVMKYQIYMNGNETLGNHKSTPAELLTRWTKYLKSKLPRKPKPLVFSPKCFRSIFLSVIIQVYCMCMSWLNQSITLLKPIYHPFKTNHFNSKFSLS